MRADAVWELALQLRSSHPVSQYLGAHTYAAVYWCARLLEIQQFLRILCTFYVRGVLTPVCLSQLHCRTSQQYKVPASPPAALLHILYVYDYLSHTPSFILTLFFFFECGFSCPCPPPPLPQILTTGAELDCRPQTKELNRVKKRSESI